jgi:hypothetical protein
MKSKKAISLEDQIDALETEIAAALNATIPAPAEGETAMQYEVEEVFDTYAIVMLGDAQFQVDYSRAEDGTLTVGEPVPVEQPPAEDMPAQGDQMPADENPIKAISRTPDELRVANYIVLFGGRDLTGARDKSGRMTQYDTGPRNKDGSQGEYFTKATRFDSDYTKADTLSIDFEHGYDPDEVGADSHAVMGRVDWKTAKVDDRGVFVERVLNRRQKYVQWLEGLIDDGLIGSSSVAVPGRVQKAANGEIQTWPLMRDSLTVSPMEPRMLTANHVAAIKALSEIAPRLKSLTSLAETPVSVPGKSTKNQGVSNMDKQEFDRLYAERKAQEAKEAQATAARQAEIDAAVKAATAANDAEWAKHFRLPTGNMKAPGVTQFSDTGKYDHLSAADLALAIDVQNNLSFNTPKMPQVSRAAIKALALKVARIQEEHVSRDTEIYAKSAAAIKFGGLDDAAIKAATDPAYSTGSLIGSDWVGTAYSNQIWEAIRAGTQVVANIPSEVIPDGYSSEYWPLEGADPTWYLVPEVTAADSTMKIPAATVTASQMATATKQITIKKPGARAMYSGELTEDSVIRYVEQLRKQLEISGREMMEMIAIDGDVATSSNINDIGGTTYSGAATSLFLATNGFRKSPLVTTTANSRSAQGSLSENDYLETMWLMGTAGIGSFDLAKCGFIIDPNVYKKSLMLATLKTKDVWTQATMETGVLTKMWGYPVIPSWFMHYASAARLANSAGKVDQTTTTNNLYGGIIAVRWDQWKLAYKRMMTMETTRFANSDSWEIVALTRWGMGQRDTEASAITYYVGV